MPRWPNPLHKLLVSAVAGCLLLLASACVGGGSSRDGEIILYIAGERGDTDVYSASSDTGEVIRLTSIGGNHSAPAWAPNRSNAAYLSDRNGTTDMWLSVPGGAEERIAFTGLKVDSVFSWAPDSRRVAYEIEVRGARQIMVGNVATGTASPLTSSKDDARLGGWSPDGEWIVYTLVGGEQTGIYKGNPDGVNEIQITPAVGERPLWSPNGRWIAYGGDEGGLRTIFVIPSGGGETNSITANAGNNYGYVWSADGERLAFVSDRDGNEEIYTIEAVGSGQRRLTSNRVSDTMPVWSQINHRIAFLSDIDGDYDIFTMRSDGSDQKRVTTTNSDILDLNW